MDSINNIYNKNTIPKMYPFEIFGGHRLDEGVGI